MIIRRMFRGRGYTLTEMLFVLMLMGVASVLMMRLFTGSMRVIRTAPASQDRLAAIDRATASLRQDVWSATSIQVPDARTLHITTPDGKQIRWSFSDQAISRSTHEHEQTWPTHVSLLVQRQRSQVVLEGPDDDELRFTSQLLAMNGGNP